MRRPHQLVSAQRAAELVGVSATKIKNIVESEEIDSTEVEMSRGRIVRFVRLDDLEAWRVYQIGHLRGQTRYAHILRRMEAADVFGDES